MLTRRRMIFCRFSSATISSELKWSSTFVISKNNWRHRSSSWPSNTMNGTVSATSPRCVVHTAPFLLLFRIFAFDISTLIIYHYNHNSRSMDNLCNLTIIYPVQNPAGWRLKSLQLPLPLVSTVQRSTFEYFQCRTLPSWQRASLQYTSKAFSMVYTLSFLWPLFTSS